MQLTGALARHERRVRLIFDTPIAPAGLTTPSLYAVTGPDGVVPVAGLVIIAGEPYAIDLALGADLVVGVTYVVSASDVPGSDGTTAGAGETFAVGLPAPAATENQEATPSDLDELLYGVDLVWSGDDYAETADGDLASVSGPENVRAALGRRFQSDGLPWDDTYGAKPRAYIDGSPSALTALKGALLRQAQLDDRVRQATTTLTVNDTDATFEVDVDLLGDGDSVNLAVPTNAGG